MSTGPDADCEYELFQEDLDRLEPHIEAAINRVPAFGEVGVKKVYNGAICYTPDGSPIVGPAWGLQQLLAQRGPQLRHHRRRRRRLAAGRVDRRGRAHHRHAGRRSAPLRRLRRARPICGTKNEEAYANVFTIHYPDEERAGRAAAASTAPCYERMQALGAVFGQKSTAGSGPTGSRPRARPAEDDWSFRRSQLLRARRQRVPQRDGATSACST